VLLAGAVWRAYRLTYVRIPRRAAGLRLVPVDETHPPLNLRLGPVFRWRSTMLRTLDGRTVWLAGEDRAPAVLAVHPGPSLFPTRLVRPRELESYQKALTRIEAVRRLSPPERRAVLIKTYQRSELRLVFSWGCLGLLTISHPSTVAWITLAAESLVWGLAVVRLRLARDHVLEESGEKIESDADGVRRNPQLI
jgi:hypothetical protein